MDLKTAVNLFEIRQALSSGKTIFDLPLMVTFYARVSTDKYEQEKSLKDQIDYYKNMIKNNPNWTYVEGYIDEGISGTSTLKRDAFLQMIRDSKLGMFNLILTKEISRFSRNTLDSIKYTQELLANNIGVFFETDNINTFMPDSELRLTIMSSMAQEEVRKLSERVKFGFQRSIKSGRVLGNDDIWGYRKDKCKLVIDEAEAEAVRKIFDLYVNEHIGMRTIAKRLTDMGYKSKKGSGHFAPTTVAGILQNPKYKGYYCGNKTRVVDYRLKTVVSIDEDDWVMYKDEENVPAIVSEEIWNKAQYILQERSSKLAPDKRVYQNRYVFSGKIKCMEHNQTYQRKVTVSSGVAKKRKINWACSEYLKHGKQKCNTPLIYEEELFQITKKSIHEFIKDKEDIIDDLISEYTNNMNSLNVEGSIAKKQADINRTEQKKETLLDLKVDGSISRKEFVERNNKLNEDLTKLKKELTELNQTEKKFKMDEDRLKLIKNIVNNDLLEDDDYNEEIIRTLLDRMEVYKTEEEKKVKLKIYLTVGKSYEGLYDGKKHQFSTTYTYD